MCECASDGDVCVCAECVCVSWGNSYEPTRVRVRVRVGRQVGVCVARVSFVCVCVNDTGSCMC
jgi:hypothetical protein